MSTVQTEQVMVVKTSLFRECGYFEGFSPNPESYLGTLLDPANTDYRPRGEMEEDPSYKQLIPYCIFQYTDEQGVVHVFRYTRGSGGGEARLRAKKSVGVGGHVSTLDASDESPYREGMRRELDEEIEIGSEYKESLIGLINDDSNDVGKVHLGVLHLFEVESPSVRSREDDLTEAGFQPVTELMEDLERFETWSQICLRQLYG